MPFVFLLCKLDTKEASRIGYSGFPFPHSYSGKRLGDAHVDLHGVLMLKKILDYERLKVYYSISQKIK